MGLPAFEATVTRPLAEEAAGKLRAALATLTADVADTAD